MNIKNEIEMAHIAAGKVFDKVEVEFDYILDQIVVKSTNLGTRILTFGSCFGVSVEATAYNTKERKLGIEQLDKYYYQTLKYMIDNDIFKKAVVRKEIHDDKKFMDVKFETPKILLIISGRKEKVLSLLMDAKCQYQQSDKVYTKVPVNR